MGSTLREALESAVSAQEAKESSITAAEPVVETEQAAQVVQPAATETPIGETAEQRAERLRDEKGRFVEGKVKQDKPIEAKPAEAKPATPEVKPIPRPSSWEKSMWPIWDKLNAGVALDAKEARQLAEYNVKRESDFARGVSTYKQEWDNAKPLIDAMAPFLPELEAHHIKPNEWITNLGRAHYALAKGSPQAKLQMFAQLSREYGVPLQALVDPQVAQQFVQQTIQNPPTPAPQQDVASLVRQEILTARLNDEIRSFEEAKDTAGNPLYPHYQTVKGDMALLLEAGKAQDLKGAYHMALRLHDDLFEAEQEAKRKADDTARQEAQRKAVAAAKGSAVSVKSATPASAGAAPKGSRREVLSEAWDQHTTGRV